MLVHKGKVLACYANSAGTFGVSILDSFTKEKELYRATSPIFTKDEIYFWLDEHKYFIERVIKVDSVSDAKIAKEIDQGRVILANSPENPKSAHGKSASKNGYYPTLWT